MRSRSQLRDAKLPGLLALLGLLAAGCAAGASPDVVGRLPDGRGYELGFDPNPSIREPTGISAAIVVDLEEVPFTWEDVGCSQPCSPVLGIADFQPGPTVRPSYEDGVFSASSGDWILTIAVYDHVIEVWQVDLGRVLVESIQPVEGGSALPAFQMLGPLRWATDTEVPLQMEVQYNSFVVRRGCGRLNVGCSPSQLVQVIPADAVFSPAPAWNRDAEVTVADAN